MPEALRRTVIAALAVGALGCQGAPPRGVAPPRDRAQAPRREAGFAELYGEPALVPTPHEERARHTVAVAGELARSLERFPGVVDARVHLALPRPAEALDAPAAAPAKASVLVRRRAEAAPLDEAAVRALVSGAVAGLDATAVTVVQVRSAAQPPAADALTQIGPIRVTRGTAPALKAVLGAVLGCNLLLAAGLIAALHLRRRALRAPWPARAPDAPDPGRAA